MVKNPIGFYFQFVNTLANHIFNSHPLVTAAETNNGTQPTSYHSRKTVHLNSILLISYKFLVQINQNPNYISSNPRILTTIFWSPLSIRRTIFPPCIKLITPVRTHSFVKLDIHIGIIDPNEQMVRPSSIIIDMEFNKDFSWRVNFCPQCVSPRRRVSPGDSLPIIANGNIRPLRIVRPACFCTPRSRATQQLLP